MFYNLPPAPHLLRFSPGLSIPPLLHFTAWTPTEWKTAGLGTARSTLCPILQWIPIYLSPFPPLSSVLPCCLSSFEVWPRSWNKRKTVFMRTCFSPTYGTRCLSSFLWICFPTLLPGDSLLLLVFAFDKLKTWRFNTAPLAGRKWPEKVKNKRLQLSCLVHSPFAFFRSCTSAQNVSTWRARLGMVSVVPKCTLPFCTYRHWRHFIYLFIYAFTTTSLSPTTF